MMYFHEITCISNFWALILPIVFLTLHLDHFVLPFLNKWLNHQPGTLEYGSAILLISCCWSEHQGNAQIVLPLTRTLKEIEGIYTNERDIRCLFSYVITLSIREIFVVLVVVTTTSPYNILTGQEKYGH